VNFETKKIKKKIIFLYLKILQHLEGVLFLYFSIFLFLHMSHFPSNFYSPLSDDQHDDLSDNRNNNYSVHINLVESSSSFDDEDNNNNFSKGFFFLVLKAICNPKNLSGYSIGPLSNSMDSSDDEDHLLEEDKAAESLRRVIYEYGAIDLLEFLVLEEQAKDYASLSYFVFL